MKTSPLTLRRFIKSLRGLELEVGDIPVSMFDNKSGAFSGFSSLILPRPDRLDGDFMGLIAQADVKTFLELATAPETAPQ